MSPHPSPRGFCRSTRALQADLVASTLSCAPAGTGRPEEVNRFLQCLLERHADGDHFAHVMDLEGADSGAVWTCWTTEEREPVFVFVLADCPASSADGMEACASFKDHPGAHTWRLLR